MGINMELVIKVVKNTILILAPAYSLYSYLKTKRELAAKFKEKQIFHAKHNCVVMYAKDLGMSGWPEYPERLKLDLKNIDKFREPIIYYINTAKKSLDIAIMIVNYNLLGQALINAIKRGVTVRIITDGENLDKSGLKILKKAGADILYHGQDKLASIMHYKYMLKDVSVEKSAGYVMYGSINWSLQALTENYEDLVFTSHPSCVMQMHNNFEANWKFLLNERESIPEIIYEVKD